MVRVSYRGAQIVRRGEVITWPRKPGYVSPGAIETLFEQPGLSSLGSEPPADSVSSREATGSLTQPAAPRNTL